MKFRKDCALFMFGGLAYAALELICRRRTHWSMFMAGGSCFLTLFKIFTRYKKIALPLKCVVGSAVITTVEFAIGMVVNVKLKLNVWDYTNMHFNLFGQICPFYSLLWGLLTVPISFICKRIDEYSNKAVFGFPRLKPRR